MRAPDSANAVTLLSMRVNKPSLHLVSEVVVSEVEEILRRHFVSPSAVLWPACRALSIDPALITAEDLKRLSPLVGSLVKRVTDSENAESVLRDLAKLAG